MKSFNSSWVRGKQGRITSPNFSSNSARVIFNFRNREKERVFSHNPCNITFQTSDITERRNEKINEVIGQRDIGGFKVPSVSHSHIPPYLMDDELRVVGHGTPVKGGYENCKLISSTCSDGTDTKCQPGKCLIGKVSRVSGNKWLYESLTVPDLYYYVFGEKQVTLKTVLRGKFSLPAGAGTVDVTVPASVRSTVYLPPSTYAKETFVRRIINYLDRDGNYVSIQDTANQFIRSVLDRNMPTIPVEKEVYDRLVLAAKSEVDGIWYQFVEDEIRAIWESRYSGSIMSNRTFALSCYESLGELFTRGIQEAMSSISPSRVIRDEEIARPIYNRLPGVSGAYNDESGDTVGQWLTSGADEQLSYTKTLLDNFYTNYLNPETCKSENLDWMAQHLGFTEELWDLNWSSDMKRMLIKNAHTNQLQGDIWTTNPTQSTLNKMDLSKIERVSVNQLTGQVSTSYRYSIKQYNTNTDLTSILTSNVLKVDVSRWTGILPSRGSLTTLVFMFWVLGVKAPSPEEMKYNSDDGTFSVKSGLRSREYSAPINLPYTVDTLRVGSETDAEVMNYPNQLIAGVSVCQDDSSSNMVVIRMPFYYNRDGRTWDTVTKVVNTYIPATTQTKIQYAYAAADLLVAGDIFFEPVVV
jgi:hypothetical protein